MDELETKALQAQRLMKAAVILSVLAAILCVWDWQLKKQVAGEVDRARALLAEFGRLTRQQEFRDGSAGEGGRGADSGPVPDNRNGSGGKLSHNMAVAPASAAHVDTAGRGWQGAQDRGDGSVAGGPGGDE